MAFELHQALFQTFRTWHLGYAATCTFTSPIHNDHCSLSVRTTRVQGIDISICIYRIPVSHEVFVQLRQCRHVVSINLEEVNGAVGFDPVLGHTLR